MVENGRDYKINQPLNIMVIVSKKEQANQISKIILINPFDSDQDNEAPTFEIATDQTINGQYLEINPTNEDSGTINLPTIPDKMLNFRDIEALFSNPLDDSTPGKSSGEQITLIKTWKNEKFEIIDNQVTPIDFSHEGRYFLDILARDSAKNSQSFYLTINVSPIVSEISQNFDSSSNLLANDLEARVNSLWEEQPKGTKVISNWSDLGLDQDVFSDDYQATLTLTKNYNKANNSFGVNLNVKENSLNNQVKNLKSLASEGISENIEISAKYDFTNLIAQYCNKEFNSNKNKEGLEKFDTIGEEVTFNDLGLNFKPQSDPKIKTTLSIMSPYQENGEVAIKIAWTKGINATTEKAMATFSVHASDWDYNFKQEISDLNKMSKTSSLSAEDLVKNIGNLAKNDSIINPNDSLGIILPTWNNKTTIADVIVKSPLDKTQSKIEIIIRLQNQNFNYDYVTSIFRNTTKPTNPQWIEGSLEIAGRTVKKEGLVAEIAFSANDLTNINNQAKIQEKILPLILVADNDQVIFEWDKNDFPVEGSYQLIIKVKNKYGNFADQNLILKIKNDFTAPQVTWNENIDLDRTKIIFPNKDDHTRVRIIINQANYYKIVFWKNNQDLKQAILEAIDQKIIGLVEENIVNDPTWVTAKEFSSSNPEGLYILDFKVVDQVGNESHLQFEILIDKTPPKINWDDQKTFGGKKLIIGGDENTYASVKLDDNDFSYGEAKDLITKKAIEQALKEVIIGGKEKDNIINLVWDSNGNTYPKRGTYRIDVKVSDEADNQGHRLKFEIVINKSIPSESYVNLNPDDEKIKAIIDDLKNDDNFSSSFDILREAKVEEVLNTACYVNQNAKFDDTDFIGKIKINGEVMNFKVQLFSPELSTSLGYCHMSLGEETLISGWYNKENMPDPFISNNVYKVLTHLYNILWEIVDRLN